jgi:hypothetical protein
LFLKQIEGVFVAGSFFGRGPNHEPATITVQYDLLAGFEQQDLESQATDQGQPQAARQYG